MWAMPGKPGGPDPLDRLRPGYSPSKDPALRARKMKRGLIFLGLIAGLAFAMGWNPPTGSVHSFTEASDYDAEKESGCTNSGKGCHGSEDVVHATSTRTTRTRSARRATSTRASAASRATRTARARMPGLPRRQHRAGRATACACPTRTRGGTTARRRTPRMGTDMTREMLAAEDGEARAACEDCHSRDLRKSHTGVPAVAGSTYGRRRRVRRVPQRRALVRPGGGARRLEDARAARTATSSARPRRCTRPGGRRASRRPGQLGCGQTGSGCHAVNDLHALHADKPATCAGSATAGEPGCHNLEIESHAAHGHGVRRDGRRGLPSRTHSTRH